MPVLRRQRALDKDVGRRVLELRREADVTLRALAAATSKYTVAHFHHMEKGLRLPSVEALGVLADAYGIEPRDLLLFPWRGEEEARLEEIRKRERPARLVGTSGKSE